MKEHSVKTMSCHPRRESNTPVFTVLTRNRDWASPPRGGEHTESSGHR